MKKRESIRTITPELIKRYAVFLHEQEKATATIEKYVRDLTALCEYMAGTSLEKTMLI